MRLKPRDRIALQLLGFWIARPQGAALDNDGEARTYASTWVRRAYVVADEFLKVAAPEPEPPPRNGPHR